NGRAGRCRRAARALDQAREEIAFRLLRVDPGLAEDERFLRPVLLPAILTEEHEAAVHRDLGDVPLDRSPLPVDRVAGAVDPGRDRFVRHEHLRRELLELAPLLLGRILRRLPERWLAGLL